MVAVGLLRACHPEPTVAVTAFAASLAVAMGRGAAGVAAVTVAVLAGQLSVGWQNDWLDAARDRAAGRRDKPVATGLVSRRLVGRAAAVAAVAAVPLSLVSGAEAAAVHLVAVALAWSYNLRLKATVASVVPYVLAFPALVAFVSLSRPAHPWPPWWAPATAAALGAGAHLLNAAPDLANDLAAGVRGLPQRLGRPASLTASAVLLLGGTVVVSVGPGLPVWVAPTSMTAAVATLAGGWLAGRQSGSRALFRAALGVAALDLAVLVTRLQLR